MRTTPDGIHDFLFQHRISHICRSSKPAGKFETKAAAILSDLILDVFLRTEGHVSGEDLYRLVREQDPTVGQTTVYRTLRLLTEAGLAREVRFGDGRAHYEHNYKHQHHDHMICSECGKIIEFYSPELEAIQDAMAAKYRFQLTEHLLRMIGICADCRREKKQQAASPKQSSAHAARASRR